MMSFRYLFIGIFVVEVVLCTNGIGKVAANGDWLHPLAIMGYLLGLLAIALFVSILYQNKFIFVSGDKQAIVFLLGIIFVKFLVGYIYSLTSK